jgi:hypothetical protein
LIDRRDGLILASMTLARMHPGQEIDVRLAMLFSMALPIISLILLVTHATSKGLPKLQFRKLVVILEGCSNSLLDDSV